MTTKIIRADSLIDGTGSAPVPSPVVVIDGDTITGVYEGAAPEDAVPADAEVLDYTGCTLLPGLIDAHVHLDLPGNDTMLVDEDIIRRPTGCWWRQPPTRRALRRGGRHHYPRHRRAQGHHVPAAPRAPPRAPPADPGCC